MNGTPCATTPYCTQSVAAMAWKDVAGTQFCFTDQEGQSWIRRKIQAVLGFVDFCLICFLEDKNSSSDMDQLSPE